MGYNLRIGEAVVNSNLEDRYAIVEVAFMNGKDLGAPLDPQGFAEHSNENSPSYIEWSEFAQTVGLYPTFFGQKTGLIRNHPGCEPLSEQIYDQFKKAQETYKKRSEDDWNVVRLNWLVWWTRWALDNCKYPSFLIHEL